MKKSIFMLVNYTPSDLSIGITKKIKAEINAFRALGCIVYYTAYADDGVVIYDNRDKVIYAKKFLLHSDTYQSFSRYFLLLDTAYQFIKNSKCEFDLCYGRFSAPSNKYIKTLKLMKKRGMTILIESLSYFPGMTFKSLKGKYIIQMIKVNQKKLPNCIDYFLTEGTFRELYGVPAHEIRMGVDTLNIFPHQYNGNHEQLNMISVANETMYHGYDRIIKSIAQYIENKGNVNVNLHLVGVINSETKKLIERYSLDKIVILHGKKFGAELDEIYNSCNVGVGPLGPHRMGGKKDTGLKTKEYFAKGLPYFYAGQEIPELKNCPYIMEVPSDESYISIDKIWSFYCGFRDNKEIVPKMREIAMKYFSWKSIMQDVLELIE